MLLLAPWRHLGTLQGQQQRLPPGPPPLLVLLGLVLGLGLALLGLLLVQVLALQRPLRLCCAR